MSLDALNDIFGSPTDTVKEKASTNTKVAPVSNTGGSRLSNLDNIFGTPEKASTVEVPKGDGSVISQGKTDTRKEDTLLSRIGRAVLPHFAETAFGISEEQRKPKELTQSETVRMVGTAQTIEQMRQNPQAVSNLEYLRRGISFGNNLDPEELITGYKSTVSVEDMPEPTTTPQKLAQAAGGLLTMAIAQPLIESAAAGLITKIPNGAKFLETLKTAGAANPWTTGFGLSLAKSAAEGGLFGLITENKRSVAENVLESAGTFAAFTAIAYPIAQFFKPIIQSVGTMNIENPRLKNLLNDPQVKAPTISKTLWFKNPNDPTQLLKVTGNGMEFVSKGAGEVVENGVKVTDIPTLTRVDIEAFQTKPSVYENLKSWISGKVKGKTVPFTVKDSAPVPKEGFSVTVVDPKIEAMTSAELRNQVSKLGTEVKLTPDATTAPISNAFAQTQNALSQFENANRDTKIVINAPDGSVAANVDTVEYSDGKFAVEINASTNSTGMTLPFSQSQLFNTEKEALKAANKELVSWAKSEIKKATDEDVAILQSIIDGGVNSPTGLEVTEKGKIALGKFKTADEWIGSLNVADPMTSQPYEKLVEFFNENKPKNQYPTIHEGGVIKMVDGEPVEIVKGVDTFLHEGTGGWVVSESSTGRFIAESRTKEGAIAKAKVKIDEVGIDTFKKTIKKNVLPSTKKASQKEVVKETVKEAPKSIKQIAKETGIKEPNVRRILGMGAKEGTFERVDNGVYVLNNGKEDIAYIHTGDAVETLPKLAKDGLKVDMVFLDIPYNTPAVKGGSRGVKYDLISQDQFRTVMKAVSKIVKDDNTPVYYMFSQAESGLKAMLKYNDVMTEEGFKVIAKGDWQKLFNNGAPVTNVRGEISRPEGILLFNKSGEFTEKDQARNLDFTTVRPKGYSTEKPAELLKSLILQGTKEGDTVLDPFAGSGVTGSEAIKAKRKAVLIEKNPQVVEEIISPRVRKAFIETDALNTEIAPVKGEIGLGAEKDGNFLSKKELEENGEAVKIVNEEVSRESKAFVDGQNAKPKKINQSKSFASMDKFRETMAPVERAIDAINPIEFPELVKLARELTGDFPKVKMPRFRPSMGGSPLGIFHAKGDGKITLNPDLFKEGNEEQAAKTLAHEIGHLIDYLPEKSLARGNILGRLAVLDGFRKDFYAEAGVTRTNEELQRELWALSKWWKPVDEETAPQSFLAYRKSAVEVYADFISVLFNDPKLAQQMAPQAYNVFFKMLDKKPEVKSAYFELQDLLSGTTDELMTARQEDIRKGFARGEDLQAGFAAKKEAKEIKFWERLRQQVDDINYPILKEQRMKEANGHVFTEENNPKFVLQEQSMVDNENFLLVEKIDREIVKPIEEAGMIIEDMGEYLLLDRIVNERVNIANPFGFNTKNAPKQMDFLKKTVGEENFKLLEQKVKEFHDLVYLSVEEAVAVGSYNKELFETKIKPNKDHYASFQVVDYMQDYMPATVKGQVGTLKEVANPFISTILKTVALNRLNAYQRAKNATIAMLKTDGGTDITPTKRITSDGKLSIFKPARDKGAIEVLEDGKMTSYDVDPYIAESFKKMKVGDLNMLVGLLDKFNNKLFKPIVTTYNLGFALGFNPIRDFKRNYKMIPNATVLSLLKAYAGSIKQAGRYAKGDLDDFTRSLVESKAINAPVNDYNYDPARDDELGNILKKYGLITEDKPLTNKTLDMVRKKLLKPVAQVLEGVRFLANTFEIVSKIAGAKVRMAGGESGKQLAYNLRNYTGTPNYKVRGKQTGTTNAIFVFSNIMKEGLKSDFKVATDPNTRAGYWWKTVKIDILPKFIMFLAAAGALGVGVKKYFDNISEYDKSNYLILPMGTDDNGKAVYMRIPHDETGRLLSSLFWKMANFAKDGKPSELQDIFALGAGQLPSVTPSITVLENWTQYLSGRNPYDAFHGRTLIDDTTWQAGGGAALKKMIQWTTNNLGFTKFATYDTSKNTGVETFMQVAPWFSSLIKISDYGQQEKLKQIKEEVKQDKAKQTLFEREVIEKYIKQAKDDGKLSLFSATKYGNKAVKEILGHAPQSKAEQDHGKRIIQKFTLATKRGTTLDPRYMTIIDADSNDEKKAILKSIKEDSTAEEYATIKQDLLKNKIVTPELLYSVK